MENKAVVAFNIPATIENGRIVIGEVDCRRLMHLFGSTKLVLEKSLVSDSYELVIYVNTQELYDTKSND